MTMDVPVDVAKMVHDHLVAFHKHYKLPRYFADEDFLIWCKDHLGKEYRDWSFRKGHKKDPYSVIHIKDPKWCLLFEIKWAHLIIGTVDIK